MSRATTKAVILIGFVIIVHVPLLYAQENSFKFKTEEDLDGDGKKEEIVLKPVSEKGDFILAVNSTSIFGKLGEEAVDGFIVVDVDQRDRYREIAVHNPGPSSDDMYCLYWYDGSTIRKMGVLSRWPTFPGNGIVLVDDWMGFWSKRDKYTLDPKTRQLVLIPQEFYYVGVEGIVKEQFPIYRTREGNDIIANLKKESSILILAWAPTKNKKSVNSPEGWYLIKSSTGLLGWTTAKVVFERVGGLPLAD